MPTYVLLSVCPPRGWQVAQAIVPLPESDGSLNRASPAAAASVGAAPATRSWGGAHAGSVSSSAASAKGGAAFTERLIGILLTSAGESLRERGAGAPDPRRGRARRRDETAKGRWCAQQDSNLRPSDS